jgi:hypothetical protein
MNIANRSRVVDDVVRDIAKRSLVSAESFLIWLDDAENAVRADAARKNLEEHPNWQYMRPGWEKEATGEADTHACTVCKRVIANQRLPPYIIEAIAGYNLLVYIDGMWTNGSPIGFALTLAHELRHVWQYFNAPLVFHSQTPLSWVVPSELTPCEIDAEKSAKHVLGQLYGNAGVSTYLDGERTNCKPEHREFMERLVALDPAPDPEREAKTIALLEEHAAEIRKFQIE